MSTPLYPLFLKLSGKPVVVIGAGVVAARKIQTLVDAGARVRVISPNAVPSVRALANEGALDWRPRDYEVGDLNGAVLAVAATDRPEVHALVRREADETGVWLNVVDVPAHCDFYMPAVARWGELMLAISTQGQAPMVARLLREHLEVMLDERFVAALDDIVRERERLRRLPGSSMEERRHALEQYARIRLADVLPQSEES